MSGITTPSPVGFVPARLVMEAAMTPGVVFFKHPGKPDPIDAGWYVGPQALFQAQLKYCFAARSAWKSPCVGLGILGGVGLEKDYTAYRAAAALSVGTPFIGLTVAVGKKFWEGGGTPLIPGGVSERNPNSSASFSALAHAGGPIGAVGSHILSAQGVFGFFSEKGPYVDLVLFAGVRFAWEVGVWAASR